MQDEDYVSKHCLGHTLRWRRAPGSHSDDPQHEELCIRHRPQIDFLFRKNKKCNPMSPKKKTKNAPAQNKRVKHQDDFVGGQQESRVIPKQQQKKNAKKARIASWYIPSIVSTHPTGT